MRIPALVALSLFAALPAFPDCRNAVPHRLTAEVGDATVVVIVGRAGSLRVRGGSTNVVSATGEACASDRDFLSHMRIEARRDGRELKIEAVIPEKHVMFGFHQARLDFEVVVPSSMPVRVVDGSGELSVRDVASVEIDDGSGEIEVRDVRGDVKLRDGSGSIDIDRVGGSVRVVADGSGSMEIRDVARDVVIEADGSGSIDVADVRGNFIVERDGSGGIDYDRVSGTVRVPSRD